MGPSLESNGMAEAVDLMTEYPEGLQWGRRSKATECELEPVLVNPVTPLQWGRRSKATEWANGPRDKW